MTTQAWTLASFRGMATGRAGDAAGKFPRASLRPMLVSGQRDPARSARPPAFAHPRRQLTLLSARLTLLAIRPENRPVRLFFGTGTGMPGIFTFTEPRVLRVVKNSVFQSSPPKPILVVAFSPWTMRPSFLPWCR
jgi:hypothetical protein